MIPGFNNVIEIGEWIEYLQRETGSCPFEPASFLKQKIKEL